MCRYLPHGVLCCGLGTAGGLRGVSALASVHPPGIHTFSSVFANVSFVGHLLLTTCPRTISQRGWLKARPPPYLCATRQP